MPELPSLSILHRQQVFLTPDKFVGLHSSPVTLKRTPAVICRDSTVCGTCTVYGTGKVIEFYDQEEYEFTVAVTTFLHPGTGPVHVYTWDRLPNRSTSNPPEMLGFNFYQQVNSGSKFKFKPDNARWLSFMQQNSSKNNYLDALCVQLNMTTKTITALSF